MFIHRQTLTDWWKKDGFQVSADDSRCFWGIQASPSITFRFCVSGTANFAEFCPKHNLLERCCVGCMWGWIVSSNSTQWYAWTTVKVQAWISSFSNEPPCICICIGGEKHWSVGLDLVRLLFSAFDWSPSAFDPAAQLSPPRRLTVLDYCNIASYPHIFCNF